ncbi:MAG TPA: hypothetical protein PKE03_02600 [Bacteroidales bacterium]|nr:hypothetical protein [Bacteroidales bacterium]
MLVSKKSIRWEASITYMLSKTMRRFSEFNQGMLFSFVSDRPHDINVLISYEISPTWKFTANWLYQSGIPFTPVIGRYPGSTVDREILTDILNYGPKNSSRLKDIHRLDISSKHQKCDLTGKPRSIRTFGLYNAYNRKNPAYYFYLDESMISIVYPNYRGKLPVQPAIWQMSIFPIMPVVSYKYN